MKRILFLIAIFLCQGAALAAPWHYGLLEDFQKSGDVGVVKDDGIQGMSFTVNHPKALVAKGVASSLDQLSIPLEATKQGSVTEYLTEWVAEPTSFMQPFPKRKRFRIALAEVDQDTTGVFFSAPIETKHYGWEPAPGLNTRNSIREIMALVVIYCRFPNTPEVRTSVYDSFKEKGTRVGKKGYELPPTETWIEERSPLLTDGGLQATKTCPFCAEEILAAAIKCKHCGEFLGKLESAGEPEQPSVIASAQGASTTGVPTEVLLGEVVDNSTNPGEKIGARSWIGITWSPSNSAFIVKITEAGGSGTFDLSPVEMIEFTSRYQKAVKIAESLPAGKITAIWECRREDGAYMEMVAAQVPDIGLQTALVSIREKGRPVYTFAAPVWWPTKTKFAFQYGEVSTKFESLLGKAQSMAKEHIKTP